MKTATKQDGWILHRAVMVLSHPEWLSRLDCNSARGEISRCNASHEPRYAEVPIMEKNDLESALCLINPHFCLSNPFFYNYHYEKGRPAALFEVCHGCELLHSFEFCKEVDLVKT